MSTYFSALVWVTLAAQVIAWPTARLHEASGGLMRLPPSDRAIVERLLHSQLGPMAQGEDAGQIKNAIQSFRVERISLGGMSALAIQATGNDLCGAPGNCSFWIIDLPQRRIVFHADGVQQFAVDQRSKSRFADVITSTHESALESELIRWQFTGGIYRPSACATRDFGDSNGNPLPQPKITPHPCTPEGN
jgi:hypothetical protein